MGLLPPLLCVVAVGRALLMGPGRVGAVVRRAALPLSSVSLVSSRSRGTPGLASAPGPLWPLFWAGDSWDGSHFAFSLPPTLEIGATQLGARGCPRLLSQRLSVWDEACEELGSRRFSGAWPVSAAVAGDGHVTWSLCAQPRPQGHLALRPRGADRAWVGALHLG